LREDLGDIIKYARKHLRCEIWLSTNGTNLNSSLIKTLLRSGLRNIRTSIHSHDPKIHDTITGVEGSWKKLLTNIDNTYKISSRNKIKLNFFTNTVLVDYNY
ncbi:MAG: radical SAM protein, partial [Candidatus Thorarchaeota archaeon]